MQSSKECLCCREISAIVNKLSETEDTDSQIICITEHPGFASVCLNIWVLQAAYSQYRQQYGNYNAPLHELVQCLLFKHLYKIWHCRKYRYTAYRQLVRWCWGWLGRQVRVVLPACAVNLIRTTFPSTVYTGYTDP